MLIGRAAHRGQKFRQQEREFKPRYDFVWTQKEEKRDKPVFEYIKF